MKIQRAIYNLSLPIAHAAALAAASFNGKIAEVLACRKGLKERWKSKSSVLSEEGKLIWFHVSSAGEFLQAKPVMDLIHEKMDPSIQIALTFYSPSGKKFLERLADPGGDEAIRFVDYLPFDTQPNARFCLDTLKPDMIVYTKFDLWPNLIMETGKRGISQILISGTLSPNSKRLSRITRGFYGELYSMLTAIAAISEEDAQRFVRYAHGNIAITIAGDTRYDQVCRRIDASSLKLPQALVGGERFYVIAGSTWPGDERTVIPGFRRLIDRFPLTGLILAPHEPTAGRLEEIRRHLEREGLPFRLFSSIKDDEKIDEPVILIDGIGYLAELYRAAGLAYVGGSYGTGVHNVMEPAVLGLPVLFGPRIDNSLEAKRLTGLGAGRIVNSAEEFFSVSESLLSDRALLEKLGATASEFIRNNCGAALRCLNLIEGHLNRN